MNDSLAGKVAVVTGASSGFGRGIAVAMARQGARVAVLDLTEDTAPGNFDECPEASTRALIEGFGGEALYARTDVSRQGDVERAIASALDRFGRLDILVNNAGVWRGMTPFHLSSEADFDACFSVIVKGTFHACRTVLPHFIEQASGCIINVASTAGVKVYPLQLAYNAAKHAQIGMTKSLALEYGPSGIRVNAICPTGMKTSMNRVAFENQAITDYVVRRRPLGAWGEIADIANAAVFLASDAAGFITGSTMMVDGGEQVGEPARG